MLPDIKAIKCAICGKKSEQFCGFLSYNSHTFQFDFFGNPNIDPGSQYCPHCGYAHGSIDLIDTSLDDSKMLNRIKKLIESEDYKNCDEQKEFLNNEWEEHNYKAFLVERLMEKYDLCTFRLMHLVWHMDQRYLASYAMHISEINGYIKPKFSINGDDKQRDVKELMNSTKELLSFVLYKFYRYARHFMDNYEDKYKDRFELNDYIMLIVNYVYYQRRFGDILEAKCKLDLLKEIKNNNSLKDEIILRIEIFEKIERENINNIINYEEPSHINNAFGYYDKEWAKKTKKHIENKIK